MPQLFTNNASAPLASSIVAIDTSLSVGAGQGAKFPSTAGSNTFTITVTSADGTVQEIMLVTARSTDALTVTRAQEGTSASPFTAGAVVEARLTASPLNALMAFLVNAGLAAIAALTPSSGKIPYFTSGSAAGLLTLDTDGGLAANSDTTLASQKAVKTYTDAKVAGLSWKQAVRAATTGPGTLASSFENGDTIDGVTLATGNRILIKDQSAPAENGIYTVNASGAPTRATDADAGSELVNASVYVSEGTANADTQWTCTTNATITINSTSLAFAQLATGGPPTGSAGGSLSGTYPNPSIASSVSLPGSPTTTTQSPGDNSTKVATTAYADAAVSAAAVAALDDIGDVNTSGVSDGDVLTYDVGSGDWVAAAPSGGGGSVTGSFDVYDGDAPEASPSSLDDDFNSSTINAKYALVNMASNTTYDVDTTKPGSLYIRCTANDVLLHCVLDTIPSGDFVYQTRIDAATTSGANNFFGLCLADGATPGSGSQRIAGFSFEGSGNLLIPKTYSWTGFNSAGSGGSGSPIFYDFNGYFRVRRVGTTIYQEYSRNGRVWYSQANYTEAFLGFTVTRCGPFVRNGNGDVMEICFDHVRYSTTTTHLFGGKVRLALTT